MNLLGHFKFLKLNSRRFWQALQQTGIRRSDPRLEKMVANLNDIKNEAFGDTPLESLELDRRQFKRCGNLSFVILHEPVLQPLVL